MIITDVNKIDEIVKDIVVKSKGQVKIDWMDYATIRSSSTKLRLTDVNIPIISADTIKVFEEAVNAIFMDEKCNLMFYIRCDESFGKGENRITVEQISLLADSIEKNAKINSALWGMEIGEGNPKGVSILLIVGKVKE